MLHSLPRKPSYARGLPGLFRETYLREVGSGASLHPSELEVVGDVSKRGRAGERCEFIIDLDALRKNGPLRLTPEFLIKHLMQGRRTYEAHVFASDVSDLHCFEKHGFVIHALAKRHFDKTTPPPGRIPAVSVFFLRAVLRHLQRRNIDGPHLALPGTIVVATTCEDRFRICTDAAIQRGANVEFVTWRKYRQPWLDDTKEECPDMFDIRYLDDSDHAH